MPAGAAAGDEHVAIALPEGERGRREAAAQIGAQRLARLLRGRLDPARVRIFLVLLPHGRRRRVGNRSKARHRGRNLAFGPRLDDLAGDQAGDRGGPIPLRKAIGGRQGAERTITCERGEPHRRNGAARLDVGDDRLPRLLGPVRFVGRHRKHILVEEALRSEGAGKRERLAVACVVLVRGRREQRTKTAHESLESDVADRARFEQATQKRIVRDHAETKRSEQRLRVEPSRPSLGRAGHGLVNRWKQRVEGRKNRAVGLVQLRGQSERPFQVDRRLLPPPLRKQNAAELVMRLGKVGRERKRPPQQLDRPMRRMRVARAQIETLPEQRLRLRAPPRSADLGCLRRWRGARPGVACAGGPLLRGAALLAIHAACLRPMAGTACGRFPAPPLHGFRALRRCRA